MNQLVAFLNVDLFNTRIARWLRACLLSLYSRVASVPFARLTRTSLKWGKRWTPPIGLAMAGVALALTAMAICTPAPEHFKLDPDLHNIAPTTYSSWHRFANRINHRSYAMLTFDDGPAGDGLDEKFLEVLRRHHTHAIFFVVCKNFNWKTIPVLGKITRDGNMIGNHSFDHTSVSALTYGDALHQIDACNSRIADITGHRPSYFRPPFGHSSMTSELAAHAVGVQSVLWTVNTRDYMYHDPAKITGFATESINDMAIILMHERAGTAAALDKILTDLEERGFTFVLPDVQPLDGDTASDG